MKLKRTLLGLAVVGLIAFATASSANAQGHHGYASHGQVSQHAYSGGHGYTNGRGVSNGHGFSNGHGVYSGHGNVGHQSAYFGNSFANQGYGGGYGNGHAVYSTPSHGNYSGGYGGFGHGGGINLQTHNFGLRIGH